MKTQFRFTVNILEHRRGRRSKLYHSLNSRFNSLELFRIRFSIDHWFKDVGYYEQKRDSQKSC